MSEKETACNTSKLCLIGNQQYSKFYLVILINDNSYYNL